VGPGVTTVWVFHFRTTLTTIYLVSVAFGITLLVGSLLLSGKDTDGGTADGDGTMHGHGDAAGGLAWAPFGSLRFWMFFFAFGGGAGLALTYLKSNHLLAALGALGMGWLAGAAAVTLVRRVAKNSVSSGVQANELIGSTGVLLLPAGHQRPGKLRVEVKGRAEDFIAMLVDDGAELPAGTEVLIVAEGAQGMLLVAKGEM
jgi:hypothetical protein